MPIRDIYIRRSGNLFIKFIMHFTVVGLLLDSKKDLKVFFISKMGILSRI